MKYLKILLLYIWNNIFIFLAVIEAFAGWKGETIILTILMGIYFEVKELKK